MRNGMESRSSNDQYLSPKSRQLIKLEKVEFHPDANIYESKNNLVLGLEHTIMAFSCELPSSETDAIEVTIQGNTSYGIFRPGLLDFLNDASKYYSISIYTTLQERLAEKILEAKGALKYISKIYHQEHCKKIGEDMYLKSLLPLGLPLKNTIFIEESSTQIRSQPLNGLLIKKFTGDSNDQALKFLTPFLEDLAKKEDFRPVAKKLYEFFNQEEIKDGQNRLETITEAEGNN